MHFVFLFVFYSCLLVFFLSPGQSAPVILDVGSEFLDEAVVDDWIGRVVDEIEINKPWRVQRVESNKKEISKNKQYEDGRVDL